MESKTTNLIEWTVEDVGREIKQTFNEDIAKKFEGKIKIVSLTTAKVQTPSLETSLQSKVHQDLLSLFAENILQLTAVIEDKHFFFSFINVFGVLAA